MNYSEAMEYIQNTQNFGVKMGLHRIGSLLKELGNPEKTLKYIHVAGTNGKGSTVAFISSILLEAGYMVGTYTSPSIQRFSERIRVNDAEIPEADIARITGLIKDKVDLMRARGIDELTEFEIVTAMAFQYFAERCCDIVVLETGLGGRLDSTNIIDSAEAAVITTINYDHMAVLGDTLVKIALEKAGIIKKNCDVVLYPQNPVVERIFELLCREPLGRLHRVAYDSNSQGRFDTFEQEFDCAGHRSLKISLLGDHQTRNAAVAVKTMEVLQKKGYHISEAALRKGLMQAKWPGRFEIVKRSPFFVVDGAHNPESVIALVRNLERHFPGKKITFITGVLADKDYHSMMKAVLPLAKRFITVTPPNKRALSAEELAGFLNSAGADVLVSESIRDAVRMGLDLCSDHELVCAFGSLYFIGEVRGYFVNAGSLC